MLVVGKNLPIFIHQSETVVFECLMKSTISNIFSVSPFFYPETLKYPRYNLKLQTPRTHSINLKNQSQTEYPPPKNQNVGFGSPWGSRQRTGKVPKGFPTKWNPIECSIVVVDTSLLFTNWVESRTKCMRKMGIGC